jgi:hypothetical protein
VWTRSIRTCPEVAPSSEKKTSDQRPPPEPHGPSRSVPGAVGSEDCLDAPCPTARIASGLENPTKARWPDRQERERHAYAQTAGPSHGGHSLDSAAECLPFGVHAAP